MATERELEDWMIQLQRDLSSALDAPAQHARLSLALDLRTPPEAVGAILGLRNTVFETGVVVLSTPGSRAGTAPPEVEEWLRKASEQLNEELDAKLRQAILGIDTQERDP